MYVRVHFQVFYTIFYSPEKDLYINEVNTTESLGNGLTVSNVYWFTQLLSISTVFIG